MLTIKDLQRLLKGAMLKGLATVGEYVDYCESKGLRTNAERLAHFTK